MGLDATVVVTICKFAILFTWGFAAWWFVMAMIITLYYITKLELPYALSWWAFTFPSGALCVASGVAWEATKFGIIYNFYQFTAVFLLLVWIVVFIRTMKGVFLERFCTDSLRTSENMYRESRTGDKHTHPIRTPLGARSI